MSLNYDFLVWLTRRYATEGSRVLDYGCGIGHFVSAAVESGFDAYGCDRFEGYWSHWKAQTVAPKERIRSITESGAIPFGDGEFDIVVANQVFEHIECFSRPLAEIHRVLKTGGIFINCFPTSDVVWEGHIKAPLAQWFFTNPKLWQRYLIAMHRLRIGKDRQGRSADEWAKAYSDLPSLCFYKSSRQVESEFSPRFALIESAEPDWIRHRLAHSAKLAWMRVPRTLDPVLKFVCTRLAGRVFIMRRRHHEYTPV